MHIHVHIHNNEDRVLQILQQQSELLIHINKKIEIVMSTQADAAVALQGIKSQLTKANTEIQTKIQALIDAAANADVSPELQTAIDDLKVSAQALDDIVPDAPTV